VFSEALEQMAEKLHCDPV